MAEEFQILCCECSCHTWPPVAPPRKPKGDCQCRKCGKHGWVINEFTSPHTGLCAECSKPEGDAGQRYTFSEGAAIVYDSGIAIAACSYSRDAEKICKALNSVAAHTAAVAELIAAAEAAREYLETWSPVSAKDEIDGLLSALHAVRKAGA